MASPDGWVVWGVVLTTRWWLLVDHCVLRNWDRILVRAVKGLISRAGMVSICPLLWQRDVKLQQTHVVMNRDTCDVGTLSLGYCGIRWRQVLLYRGVPWRQVLLYRGVPEDRSYCIEVSPEDRSYCIEVSPEDRSYCLEVSLKTARFYCIEVSPEDRFYCIELSPEDRFYFIEVSLKTGLTV